LFSTDSPFSLSEIFLFIHFANFSLNSRIWTVEENFLIVQKLKWQFFVQTSAFNYLGQSPSRFYARVISSLTTSVFLVFPLHPSRSFFQLFPPFFLSDVLSLSISSSCTSNQVVPFCFAMRSSADGKITTFFISVVFSQLSCSNNEKILIVLL